MSTTAIKSILTSVQACLDFAKLAPDIRRVASEHASEYEECLDVSLSQQMELIAGLLNAYPCLCNWETSPYFDLGEEPLSYADAIRLLDNFINIVEDAVDKALSDSSFVFPAQWISTRAQTFACVLRCRQDAKTEKDG
jgi:hypothetical protein